MTLTQEQKDGRYYIRSIYHKIGIHNLPFMLINNEWIRSTKSVEEIILTKRVSNED